MIKRTRKRQIQRAAFMGHMGYEWSRRWHKTARKPKRWKQWSNPIVYKSELSSFCEIFKIPRYSGTGYRGERRWK